MAKPMSDKPARPTAPPEGYADWLAELQARIHAARQRAALAVNRELVLLYWQIGRDILARQAQQGWGAKVIERLSQDLRAAFPEMKGFSPRNLKYMRAFAEAWPEAEFVQQAVAQLPWGHNLVLLDRVSAAETRRWYAAKAIEHNWSRNSHPRPCIYVPDRLPREHATRRYHQARTGSVPCGDGPDGERLSLIGATQSIQHRTDEPGCLRVPAVRRRVAPLHGHREPPGTDPLRAVRHGGGEGVNHGHARLRAIEIKAKENVSDRDLRGLRAWQEERLLKRYVVVSLERVPPRVEGIEMLPWQDFLGRLWEGAFS
jgi:predicted nuclease of restriction endonuclease-like (RecB) superfamily